MYVPLQRTPVRCLSPSLLGAVVTLDVVHAAFSAAPPYKGAKAALGEMLVLLNDDVTPVSRDWLLALASRLRNPEIGVAGGRLIHPNGAIRNMRESSSEWPMPSDIAAGASCWISS